MLIRQKLPSGVYPQLTQAPVRTYDEFLYFFRGGRTIDDNLTAKAIRDTVQHAMFTTAVMSGHLTRTKNSSIPDESLVDIHLTKTGLALVQNALDRIFCEEAIIVARKSITENDAKPHPHVGVVIVKDGKILATGFRGESGIGDHGEYCALKKLKGADVQGATVYTTLEPCSERNPPKKSCTERLIDGKVARVVSGSADKDESVYGHSTLVEAGIEIGFFPHELMQELHALNKKWSDSRRAKQGFPPANDTSPIANASYYKVGTSMQDNIRLAVRPPKDAGGFYTIEDNSKNVLAYGRTLEEISVEWHRIDTEKVIVEKRMRQGSGSSHRLLNLS
jgi:pyrimidine deaminase RibD-like protein